MIYKLLPCFDGIPISSPFCAVPLSEFRMLRYVILPDHGVDLNPAGTTQPKTQPLFQLNIYRQSDRQGIVRWFDKFETINYSPASYSNPKHGWKVDLELKDNEVFRFEITSPLNGSYSPTPSFVPTYNYVNCFPYRIMLGLEK